MTVDWRKWAYTALFTLVMMIYCQAQSKFPNSGYSEAALAVASNTPNAAPVTAEVPSRDRQEWLEPGKDPENRLVAPFLRHLAEDQAQFWTTPARFQKRDLLWIAPFTGFSVGLIAGDSWFSQQVPDKANQLKRSLDISNYSAYSIIAAGGGAFVLGKLRHNDHLSESGLLSGEAAINATGITYLLKGLSQRERPLQGDGSGHFFQGGASFVSEHSAIAWSMASVLAHEYPGPLTKMAAYGLASAVTLTRVTSKQHFPSDVVIGSALGWYFGRQVYRAHHDPLLGGSAWGTFLSDRAESPRNPDHMASPYVPLDSWVYDSFNRLIALGYVNSAHVGIRPWTRMECARLLEEVDEQLGDENSSDQASRIFEELSREFVDESARLNGAPNLGVRLDSLYARVTEISGRPLRDAYHFGQTIVDDYGRPYGEGLNSITGFTSHAVLGPLAFDVQGEYQRSQPLPSDPQSTRQAIADADLTLPIPNGIGSFHRFDILQGVVSLNLNNVQISFGKQSQWLGIGESGALLMSNNAEPVTMLKIDTVSPFQVPLLSKLFGPARTEFFLGKLSGHMFELNGHTLLGPGNISPQPYLHGFKLSFRPTQNLEFGMGITAQFVGPGLPFTWHNFLRTLYAHTSGTDNPGKRISEFDFSYRFPGLRKWLTAYVDTMVVDEFSPIGSTRPTLNPGIYFAQLPKLPKMELRAEGFHESLTDEFAPGFVYYGLRRYRSGYTNDGLLMGSWIGRAGRGGQTWMTYNFAPRSRFQLSYRHQEVSKDFIGGGRLVDYSASGNFLLFHTLTVSGLLQYEQWHFPLITPERQSDFTASVQLTVYPRLGLRK